MRKFYLFTLFFFSFLSVYAVAPSETDLPFAYGEQLKNSTFEAWDDISSSSIVPSGWHSFYSADCVMSSLFCNAGKAKRVDVSTDIRPGSTGASSVRTFSTSQLGVIANGNLTTGKVRMGSSTPANAANYNFTERSSLHNTVFTAKPDSMTFWGKSSVKSAESLVRVHAVIHDDYDLQDPQAYDPNSSNHIVANAEFNFNTNGEWRRESRPFNYNWGATDARYILVSMTPNQTPGKGSANDAIFVDDILMIYNPSFKSLTASTSAFDLRNEQAILTADFNIEGTFSAYNMEDGADLRPVTVAFQYANSDGTFPAKDQNIIATQVVSANGTYNFSDVDLTSFGLGNHLLRTINVTSDKYSDPLTVRLYSTFYVTYNNVEGLENNNPTSFFNDDETIALLPVSKDHYDFVGWYSDPELTVEVASIEKGTETDITLYAKFSPKVYEINYYNIDGATNTNVDNYTIETPTFSLLDAAKPYYTFAGWYAEASFENQVTEITLGSNGIKELYAKWTPINYTISYENVSGLENLNPTQYNIETPTFTLGSVSKDYYDFANWYSEAELQNRVTEIAAGSHGDLTLYAEFTPTVYTITYNNVAGATNDNVANYTIETPTFSLVDAAKPYYTFAGWYAEASFENQVTEIALGSNGTKELYAKWTPINYSITYENVDGLENTNPTQYNIETPTFTLGSVSKDSYDFDGWYSEGELLNEVSEIKQGSHGDITLYAKFSLENFAIVYNNVDGASHSNPTIYNVESSTILLLDATKPGYTFAGWFSDAALQNQVTKIEEGSMGIIQLYAKWEAIIYSITYVNVDGLQNNNPTSYSTETETIILNPVSSNDDITFDGWYKDAEFQTERVSEIVKGSFGDLTLYANFVSKEYDITYFNVDGASVNNPNVFSPQKEYILLDATKPGYKFEGWFSEETLQNLVTKIELGTNEDIQLYAKWSLATYTITYENVVGLTNNNPTNYTILSNTITLARVNKNLYTFGGWYTDENFENKVTEIKTGSYGDIVLYAKITPTNYAISYFNTDGAVNANPTSYNIETGAVVFVDAQKDGYTFAGWYSDEALQTSITQIAAGTAGSKKVYAKWTINTYNISYEKTEGLENDNRTTYSVETETFALNPLRKNSYDFVGWFSDEEFTTPVKEIAKGSFGDITLYAKMTPSLYSITYNNVDGAENSNVASYTVESSTITLADATKKGYVFGGWYSDENLTNAVTEIAAGSSGDVQLYAKWTAVAYSITYNNVEGAENNNVASFTVESSTIKLSDAVKNNYVFAGWYADENLTNAVTEILAGSFGDIQLYAKWTAVAYSITYNNIDGAENSNVASYTVESSTITLADATKNGYAFGGWYSDENLTNAVTEIAAGSTGDVQLYAKWTAIVYYITYNNVEGATHANVTSYTVETVTYYYEAATKNGYVFAGWYSDENLTNLVTELTAGSTGDIQLYAKWSFIKLEQVITWAQDFGDVYIGKTMILSAISSSSLTVTYESSDESIATVVDGQLTAHKEGDVIITAKQVGDDTYLPAQDVAVEIHVKTISNISNANIIKLDIYPNPVVDVVIIKSESKIGEVKVLNLAGSELLRQSVNSNDATINISTFNSGVYLINVDGVNHKIIKK